MNAVLIDRPEDKIGRITLNQPEKRNALIVELREGLEAGVDELLGDDDIRAIIITGNGGVFCAGGDISTMDAFAVDVARKRMQTTHQAVRRLAAAEKPVIAAVEGYAVGAGAGLALLTDTIVAGEGAKIGFPFFNVGLVPDWGLMYTVPRRVGVGRARQLFLYAKTVAASEALGLGLFDEVVPDADVQATALDRARKLARQPAHALGLAKKMLNATMGEIDEVLEWEVMAQSLCFNSSESAEGIAAFLEKRKPQF